MNDRDYTLTPAGTSAQVDRSARHAHRGGHRRGDEQWLGTCRRFARSHGPAHSCSLDDDGVGNDVTVSNGLIWAADHGADVINLSLGGDFDTPRSKDAVDYAFRSGCVVVAAAGNSDTEFYVPGTLLYPAAYPDVIAVGAIEHRLQACAVLAVRARSWIWSLQAWTCLSLYPRDRRTGEGRVRVRQRHVRGGTTRLWAWQRCCARCTPTWSASQVALALTDTAEDLGPAGFDNEYGYGLVRPDRALEVIGSSISHVWHRRTTAWGGKARLSGKLSSDNQSSLATRPVEVMAKQASRRPRRGAWSRPPRPTRAACTRASVTAEAADRLSRALCP